MCPFSRFSSFLLSHFHTDTISAHKNTLETHASTYSDTLDATTLHRTHTAVQLLSELHRHSAPPELEPEESDADSTPTAPPLPLTALYAMLSDLKGAEWRHLQVSLDSTNPADQETLQQLHKRRKTAVAITTPTASNTPVPTTDNTSTSSSATNTLTFSLADQKLADSLQGNQNSLETGTHRERIEHFLDQMSRNDEAYELFEWDNLLDTNTHAGAAFVA